ncbi:J domain-containing protein [Haematospirillum jordaniae]|uniref:J domain-containing protein n=1 Tax=Haematospirillum jordaniae TaxID=1549855 RepID=UPI0014329656|nr:J domain-containing protein [Haematospirillum jordaniae]NKD85991.1 J domain-containing protein [Haematospirillum jordaniae]
MPEIKQSYTLSCPSDFRDSILALAHRRRVNAADVARSVMLVVPEHVIESFADPGEPVRDDRETVVLKSGRAEGRPWRRKPRLQVRLPSGLEIPFIRKALNLALALDYGALQLKLGPAEEEAPPPPPPPPVPPPEPVPSVSTLHNEESRDYDAERRELHDELEQLRATVSVLAFDPIPGGITSRAEALHVLGFPPYSDPDARMIRLRFRMLATVHHPDNPYGSHSRMSQLNAAMDLLRKARPH